MSPAEQTGPTGGWVLYVPLAWYDCVVFGEVGQTDAGRLLLVVVTGAGDGRDFVITARDMTAKEKRTFRKRSR